MTDQTPQLPGPRIPEEAPVPAPAPTPAPAPESPKPGLGHIVLGAVLVLVGAGWLAETLGAANVPWRVLLPAMLVVVGLALALGARTGRHPGLIAVGAVLVLAMLMAGVVEVLFDIPLAEGVGKETNRVVGVAQVEYRWGVGSMIIDLTQAQMPPGGTIETSVALGELVVILPPGLTIEVAARSGIGDVAIFGEHNAGLGARLEYADPPGIVPPLRLVAEVGMGKVEVRR
jgi:hypothetical protein